MKYCTKPNDRKDSLYHEFYRGKWDDETIWKEDSLLLHDDVLFNYPAFVDSIRDVISHYDPYEITEVTKEAWRKIGAEVLQKGGDALDIYKELKLPTPPPVQNRIPIRPEQRKSGTNPENLV